MPDTNPRRAPVYDLSDDDYRTFLRSRSGDGFHGTTIGGSDIGAIMGLSPFATAGDVYDRILGIATPRESNAAMRRGVSQESLILHRWMNAETAQGCMWSVEASVDLPPLYLGPNPSDGCLARASADAIATNPNTGERFIIEIKSMGEASFRRLHSDGVPLSYMAQVQWYLMVAGLTMGIFVAEGADMSEPLFIANIYRDDAYITRMREAAVAFWRDHVMTRIRPPATTPTRRRGTRPAPQRVTVTDPITGMVTSMMVHQHEPVTFAVGPDTGMPLYAGGASVHVEHESRRAAHALAEAVDRQILADYCTPAADRTQALVDEAWLAKQVLDAAKAEYETASEALKAYMEINNWTGAAGAQATVALIESTRTSVDWAAYRRDHPSVDVAPYERRAAVQQLRFTAAASTTRTL